MTASTAVDDRASNECFRHQGYASAIQKASNPASSQAFAIATVSRTGSMLSCSTPMLNGIDISQLLAPWLSMSVGIFPRVFQAFDQFPQRLIQRSWHVHFFTPMHDRSIHEINFGLALGEHIL